MSRRVRRCRGNATSTPADDVWTQAFDYIMSLDDEGVRPQETTMSINPIHDYVQAVFDQRWATANFLRCMLPDVDLDECMVSPKSDRESFACHGTIVLVEDILPV